MRFSHPLGERGHCDRRVLIAVHKTTTTDVDPDDFISTVKQDRHRRESQRLLAMMRKVTGEQPRMWRPSMVGFGEHRYHYESGREGETFVVGFSPRSGKFALYGLLQIPGTASLLEGLGKYRRGAGCLYVTRLENIDEHALRELVTAAWTSHHSKYIPPCGMHLNFPRACSPRPHRSGMAWCNRCT